jgi:hypothetical protein
MNYDPFGAPITTPHTFFFVIRYLFLLAPSPVPTMFHLQEYLLPTPNFSINIIHHVFHIEKFSRCLHECEVSAAAAFEAEVTYSV